MNCIDNLRKCKASCCKYFTVKVGFLTIDQVRYYRLHGITVEKWGRQGYELIIPAECAALTKNNHCSLHNTDIKPLHCKRLNEKTKKDYYITENCIFK